MHLLPSLILSFFTFLSTSVAAEIPMKAFTPSVGSAVLRVCRTYDVKDVIQTPKGRDFMCEQYDAAPRGYLPDQCYTMYPEDMEIKSAMPPEGYTCHFYKRPSTNLGVVYRKDDKGCTGNDPWKALPVKHKLSDIEFPECTAENGKCDPNSVRWEWWYKDARYFKCAPN
ncbi:hypothetical protein M011DRAFT_459331 [Sporormia fimetaria CBS 119925]|uniref:Ig-like domain-containing protein n=1 Tax=Sporormia fimetaria CBS 119925 TaxID=1340428 RepID=A0A6A6V9K2_9PLEO|nr:hypothetical protein M011DRAFT_459331 [Sporormia fimetaria CBS 119925]